MNNKTLYQRWINNEPGFTGYGSFQTTILKAYQIADEGNQARLNAAFPNWFVKPTKGLFEPEEQVDLTQTA